ncbi:MAG: hypothetical protein ACFFDI_19780 [Promethearchaeota archaeon]
MWYNLLNELASSSQNKKTPECSCESDLLCTCKKGELHYSYNDATYNSLEGCQTKNVCALIITEMHRARCSTRHFIRHQKIRASRASTKKPRAVKDLKDFLYEQREKVKKDKK